MVFRLLALACLFAAMPVVGEDVPSVKNDPPKNGNPSVKQDSTVKKYQSAGVVTGKLVKTKVDDQLVQIDMRVAGGKYGRNEKQDFSLADDAKIRTMKLPERLDEKNKPIPYSAAEKAKLKGNDPKLPGYASELSALNSGQIVELHLAVQKPAAGSTKKDKNAEPDKPIVTMIVIVGEAPKTPAQEKAKRKP